MWQFWIDVGGTFTDCLARDPSGALHECKVLSSGVVKAGVERAETGGRVSCPVLATYANGFFSGYAVEVRDRHGAIVASGVCRRSRADELVLDLERGSEIEPGFRLELAAGEPAPVLAIRRVLGLGLERAVGRVDVRLGTTRGTNALLERSGAATCLVTTQGFGDLLVIGNQDRPRLFELDIRRPPPLYAGVVEVAERIASDGSVLQTPDPEIVARDLEAQRRAGIEAVAICLLNSYRNPEHEDLIADLSAHCGFRQVSVSSRLSPTIKAVSRGQTTVVDAYLTPVIADYVAEIRRRLPEARLMLMTSSGGLVGGDGVSGKDVILSGPAGGVVALAAVAREAGFARAIGFDMGGTSTDVSRFSGEPTYEYETEKAGVRIVAPMLAIETVAAGGGSVCDFDGQKLVVGPRSAGAEPGPACYGRGGPLAVTDANLLLGRLLPDLFPFALDREAAERAARELGARIEQAGDAAMAPEELAAGFLRIANTSMAAAIRRISVARGYDVREYALVSFGGAGGQHACAVAEDLGVSTIVVHPYAGILSAFGIGVADIRRFAVHTVLEPLSDAALERISEAVTGLRDRLCAEVEDEGAAPSRVHARPLVLEMRYAGQASALRVAEPPEGGWREAFEAAHHRRYGHVFEARDVEIVAARVEVVGEMERAEMPREEEHRRTPESRDERDVFCSGEWRRAPVFLRADLRPGDEIVGPAVIAEASGTTIVDPGWRCRTTSRRDLLLEHREERARDEGEDVAANPVELEVFNNHFAAIAEEMGAMLRRTSLSVNVKERLDFSCAVFTRRGELVANAPHMPVHLGAMSETIRCVLEDVPDLVPGDVVITNDPYRGGSHLPDVTLVTPVFDAAGKDLLFFTASRAHHAEIGGIRPGSMPPDSRRLEEEGVLLEAFKVIAAGEARFDVLRALLVGARYPSRAPDENLADISAQIAANQLGSRRLRELMEREGRDKTLAYMGHIQAAAETKVRRRLAALGDGRYDFVDSLDGGEPIAVTIRVSSAGARIDFSGTAPPLGGNLNANLAIVKAAVIYCFRCLLDEEIPLNEGVLAPLELIVPESLLNPPPAEDRGESPAVVGGNVETSQRVTDVILGALGLAAASQGTMNNLTFGDRSFGYYETICGGAGAGPGFAGASAVHTHMTNTRLTDPEVLEARYPVRLRRFAIRRGSGGRGAYPGGDGAWREIELLAPLEVSILSQRRTTRPFGLAGGEAGLAGRNRLRRAGTATTLELGGTASFEAFPGDVLIIETPGGGGYGVAAAEAGEERKDSTAARNSSSLS